MRSPGRRVFSLSLSLAAALLITVAARPARAMDFGLRLDPGVAFALTAPQSSYFGVGGAVALKASLGVGVIDFHVAGLFVGLTATASAPGSGPMTAWGAGGGLRLKRPRDRGVISPWVDADALYVRTGPLDRFGFAVGVGVAFPLGEARAVWLGPYARYEQIVQPAVAGHNTADAKLLFAGLSLEIGSSHRLTPLDSDGDGVPDAADKCPTVAGSQANGGCPLLDSDGDGVPDADDKCPTVAGSKANGGCPLVDTDGDGVPDTDDKCPTEVGPKSNGGCPVVIDTDGDGVPDNLDACPKVAGPKATKGCPDRDHDGVPDPIDLCPDTPGPAESNGCPKYKQVTVTEKAIELSEKIFFAYDKSQILPKSFALLDEVVKVVTDYRNLKVRIEGHTDGKGSERHNKKLSAGRADAVRQYLVEHGIAAERLEAVGYGSTQPLDTNKTAEGREKNRRVEFVITGGGGTASPSEGAPR